MVIRLVRPIIRPTKHFYILRKIIDSFSLSHYSLTKNSYSNEIYCRSKPQCFSHFALEKRIFIDCFKKKGGGKIIILQDINVNV